jgi:hypothetical protein
VSDLHALLYERAIPYRCTTKRTADSGDVTVSVLIEHANSDALRALLEWLDESEDRFIHFSAGTGFELREYFFEGPS